MKDQVLILQKNNPAPYRGALLPIPLLRRYEEKASVADMLQQRIDDENIFKKTEEPSSPIAMGLASFALGIIAGGLLFGHH